MEDRAVEKNVLLIDDEVDMLRGLRRSLRKRGYSVDTAEDGIQGVAKIEKSPYDVVISDLKLPRLDGIGVLERARRIRPGTVVIIITGYGTTNTAIKAMQLGAFDYIPKPFSMENLTAVLEKAVRARRIAEKPAKVALKGIKTFDVPLLVEHLMRSATVMAPVSKGKSHVFEKIERATDVVLDYTSTILPPKKFLLPREEVLFRFDREACTATLEEEGVEPVVLFGVHPCDMQGILRLDRAFSEGQPEANYLRRREAMAMVGVSCRPDEHCFCQVLGTCGTYEGFDLFLTKLPEKRVVRRLESTRKRISTESRGYLVEVITDRGAELLKGFPFFSSPSRQDMEDAREVKTENAAPRRPLGCPVGALPELFRLAEDDHLWKELADRCLSCGACNLVCPTCYCFDVTDRLNLNLKDGVRYRRWDSCQTEDFAAVATGENFREKREDRVRHRFNHKFRYPAEVDGTTTCIGCGRCSRACLADIHPAEVIEKLSGKYELSLLARSFRSMLT
jgi:DNA-binding response OmpR family regulator/formate hydrogenlyase subunit 6/NADH:ubiquinone oxidoreductase subunit I